MISFEQAIEIINNQKSNLDISDIILTEAYNYVLSQDIFSDIDMPPFDKAAMDGFACRIEDLSNDLEIVENIIAGKQPNVKIHQNQCTSITTGSPVPEGANCVIKIEDVQVFENKFVRFVADKTNLNICYRAEDIKKEQLLLKKGTLLQPCHLAILASAGIYNVPIYTKPKVGIIVTGNEILEPYEKISSAKIRNSNAYQLIGQLQKTACIPLYGGLVADNKESIKNKIVELYKNTSVILITGGASVGEFDLTESILKELGFNILFNKVSIQPGKPVIFAQKDNLFCFGLSGNPVSSFFQFEFFVSQLLKKVTGSNVCDYNLHLPLNTSYSRKKAERTQFILLKIVNQQVKLIDFNGSAHINSLADADAIGIIPADINTLKEGELIEIKLLK